MKDALNILNKSGAISEGLLTLSFKDAGIFGECSLLPWGSMFDNAICFESNAKPGFIYVLRADDLVCFTIKKDKQ